MFIAAESAPELAQLCARQGPVSVIASLNDGQIEIELQASIEADPDLTLGGAPPVPSHVADDNRAIEMRANQKPVLTLATPPSVDRPHSPTTPAPPLVCPPPDLQQSLPLSSPTQPEPTRDRTCPVIHSIHCTRDGVLSALVDGKPRKIRALGGEVIRLNRIVDLLRCRVTVTTVRYMGRGRESDLEVNAAELLEVILDACNRAVQGAAEKTEHVDYGLDSICAPLD